MKLLVVENPRPPVMEHSNDVANAPLSASLNSGYALAVARRAGWETAYLDLSASRETPETLAGRIMFEDADLILLHWVYSWGHEDLVRQLVTLLKKNSGAVMGAFGLFPTLAHQRLSVYVPQLDFMLLGEFEVTFEELLCNNIDKNSIPSLPGLYSGRSDFVRRAPLSDLSHLPIPDDVGANCRYPSMNITASRGCFGDCSFCFINRYYGCRTRRERSGASFAHELETRLKRRAVESAYLIDPTFAGHDENWTGHARQISAILKGANLPFGFETRVDTLDEDLIDALAKNGANSVFLGIESGSEAALERLNKRITRGQIIRAVRAVQSSGIRLSAGFIMFEPDSTLDELIENYDLLEELGLLSHHDQTINMLYHSQIVLYGSKSWQVFADAGRLLLDERLPFEARYRFKHRAVELVCDAMRRLSQDYFSRQDGLHRQTGVAGHEQIAGRHLHHPPGVDGELLNRILKEAFLAFIHHAGSCDTQRFSALEQIHSHRLASLLGGNPQTLQ